MCENLSERKEGICSINNKLFYNGIELPHLPHSKSPPRNITLIGDTVYANGFKLSLGDMKWKRSLKAVIANIIGWWI